MNLPIAVILVLIIFISACLSPKELAIEKISVDELLLPAPQPPDNWDSSWSGVNPGKTQATTSLRYLPTMGPAWLRVYLDENRSIFNREAGWAKSRDSDLRRLQYRDMYVYKYETWMGYRRYIAHTGGYTFVFDAGEYATDDYRSSGTPERETDELFKLVLSHALTQGLSAEKMEPTVPESQSNVTFRVKGVVDRE